MRYASVLIVFFGERLLIDYPELNHSTILILARLWLNSSHTYKLLIYRPIFTSAPIQPKSPFFGWTGERI